MPGTCFEWAPPVVEVVFVERQTPLQRAQAVLAHGGSLKDAARVTNYSAAELDLLLWRALCAKAAAA